METAGYVCLKHWYTHESVKAEAKRKLIYLPLQFCQQRDREQVAVEFCSWTFLYAAFTSLSSQESSLLDWIL